MTSWRRTIERWARRHRTYTGHARVRATGRVIAAPRPQLAALVQARGVGWLAAIARTLPIALWTGGSGIGRLEADAHPVPNGPTMVGVGNVMANADVAPHARWNLPSILQPRGGL